MAMKRSPLKRKPPKRATAAERAHMARVATLGCLVCGDPAEVHHVVSDGYKRLTRTHERVVPLCPICHRTGGMAVHAIGHARFCDHYDVNLLATADALWIESNA